MELSDDTYEWLERRILRLVAACEPSGGASLGLILTALDPDRGSLGYRKMRTECPQWTSVDSSVRRREARAMLNSMVRRTRIRTTDDDEILYLQKMLNDGHAPEPVYLPINPLDSLAESLRHDDHA